MSSRRQKGAAATLWGAITGLALLMGTGAGVASADLGVGVGASPITLGEPVLAGESYAMPPLYVLNTGTEPARYTISVERISEGEGQPVPPEWIVLGDNRFVLEPRQSAFVPVTLTVPESAPAGSYLTNLVAAAGRPSLGGGTGLGAAAAARLTFTVAGPSVSVPLPPPLPDSVSIPLPSPSRAPLWPAVALALAGALLAASLALRALGFRLHLHRRR